MSILAAGPSVVSSFAARPPVVSSFAAWPPVVFVSALSPVAASVHAVLLSVTWEIDYLLHLSYVQCDHLLCLPIVV